MKTAVDTSVLLDVLGADPTFGESSRDALRAAYRSGALVACEVVWAEVRAYFAADDDWRSLPPPLAQYASRSPGRGQSTATSRPVPEHVR